MAILEVSFREVEKTPQLEELIRKKAAKLEKVSRDLVSGYRGEVYRRNGRRRTPGHKGSDRRQTRRCPGKSRKRSSGDEPDARASLMIFIP